MVQEAQEVSEAEAQGKIKDTYDDIKATLRVPYVSSVFRALAVYPDYLIMGWRALKPNAHTLFFERYADEIRSRAAEAVSTWESTLWPPREGETKRIIRVLHYAVPKQFLATEALRSATNGQQPMLAQLPPAVKRQIAPGIPQDAEEFGLPDPTQLDERARPVLDDMARTLGLPFADGDYRILARWPDYLLSAWQVWRPNIGKPAYRQLERDLRRLAGEALSTLPFRMEIYPHALRLAGLSEQQLDAVRATLNSYSRALPGLVAYSAFLRIAADGKESGGDSPFPPSVS
jgi:hypothetical protein